MVRRRPRLPGAGAAAKPPAPPSVPVSDDAIDVRVLPATVFVERTDAGQLLNCDLVVCNTSSASFVLGEIKASVYDRAVASIFPTHGADQHHRRTRSALSGSRRRAQPTRRNNALDERKRALDD